MMKEFWNKLDSSNRELFKKYVELMESLKLSENNDLGCAYRDGEFMLIYYCRIVSERKIVALCKAQWLKDILQKIFTDKITFEAKATVMEYHLVIGFIEEFCRHYGYEVKICKSPDGRTYYPQITWQTQSSEKVKPIVHSRNFQYEKHVSYSTAQRSAIIECFKLIPRSPVPTVEEIAEDMKDNYERHKKAGIEEIIKNNLEVS